MNVPDNIGHPVHIIAVMGIVNNKRGDILLIESPRRGWEPPGGQVEQGEDLLTALKREVLEESGIVVEPKKLVAVYSNIADAPIPKLMLTVTATAVGGALATSPESVNVGWFTPEKALEMITHPTQKLKLKDALTNENVVYRTYTTKPFALLHSVEIR